MSNLPRWQSTSYREQLLTQGVELGSSKRGIEIGALHSPIISQSYGDVRFVDYADTATLRSNHKNFPDRVAGMVDVSYIWPGTGSLKDIIGTGELFDWAIASHVIEHVPNILGWFRGIAEVLRPGGILNLAIPDRRFTFDIVCPESTLGELVEADLLGFKIPSIRQMFDHCYYARAVAPGEIWDHEVDLAEVGQFSGSSATQLAYDQAVSIVKEGKYFDSHCWIFTPVSFLDLLQGACALNLCPYVLQSFVPTEESKFEFFASLRNVDPSVDLVTPL